MKVSTREADRDIALSTLDLVSARFPHRRLCQLIVNATSSDPFYVTDEELTRRLEVYLAEHGR